MREIVLVILRVPSHAIKNGDLSESRHYLEEQPVYVLFIDGDDDLLLVKSDSPFMGDPDELVELVVLDVLDE